MTFDWPFEPSICFQTFLAKLFFFLPVKYHTGTLATFWFGFGCYFLVWACPCNICAGQNLLESRWELPHNKWVGGSRCVMNSAEQSHTSNRTQGDHTKLAPEPLYIITHPVRVYSRGEWSRAGGSDPRECEPQLLLRVCTPTTPPSCAKCHQTVKCF